MLPAGTAGQQQPFIVAGWKEVPPPVVQVGSGALGHPFHLAGHLIRSNHSCTWVVHPASPSR